MSDEKRKNRVARAIQNFFTKAVQPAEWGDDKRERGWMGTAAGGKFFPLAPRAADVDIVSVARGLAMTCRYGGQVQRFYCPTPDQRVLTADLRWLAAGDLKVGDELLGFDEYPQKWRSTDNFSRRQYGHSQVLTVIPVQRRVFRLEFEDGSTVKSSVEHPWLTATRASGNQRWQETGEIVQAVERGEIRRMNKFVEPWSYRETREAGWLAGIYDGEGYFSSQNRKGTQMGVAQNPGLVLEEMRRLHRVFGFQFTEQPVGELHVLNLQVLGGWREYARLLGSIRPLRLVEKFVAHLRAGEFRKWMQSDREHRLQIVKVYDEGDQWVTGIETSSRTYLCEGFAAHNSVAEHCVLVSQHVERMYAKEALLHDSAEAYIGDMIRPLKHQPEMIEFRRAEAEIEKVILEHFKIESTEESRAAIKEIDNRILVDEITALSACPEYYLDTPFMRKLKPLGVMLQCLNPADAERAFMKRYRQFFGGVQ